MEIHISRRADLESLPYALITKWTMETEIDKMDNISNNQPSTCRKADKQFLPHLAAERPSYAFYILGSGEAFYIMTKTCNTCQQDKQIDQFYKDKSNQTGLSTQCKECEAARKRGYYKKNRDKILADNKTWRENNAERRKEYFKAYTKAKFCS